MAAHRYWGLRLEGSYPGHSGAFAEIEFRGSAGGANLCAGGTAGAGSSEVGYAPNKAFDGDSATYWYRSSVGGVVIWYDFGSAVIVAEAWFRVPGVGAAHPGASYGPGGVQVLGYDSAPTSGSGAVGYWLPYGTFATPPANGAAYTLTLAPLTARAVGQVIRQSPGWPAGPVGARAVGGVLRYDAVDGGPYRIEGVTEREVSTGVFAVYPQRRVRLFERLTGRLVRSTWSDAVTGAYSFGALKLTEYLVVTDDWSRYYNAVAADAIVPVL